MWQWIISGALVATAAFAWWLANRQLNQRGQGGGTGQGGAGEGSSDPSRAHRSNELADLRRQQAEAERRQEEQAIRDILCGEDQEVAQLLTELAGVRSGNPRSMAKDDEVIRQIARRVNPDTRKVLSFASRTSLQLERIDLQARNELKPAAYPADTFTIDPMLSDDQLGEILPEQLAMPDDVFYAQLGDDGLHIVQYHEEVRKLKRVYMLVDVSGSMDQSVKGGTRIQLAAGVAMKLMLRAQAGEAEYLLRYFGTKAYELKRVMTPAEASQMVAELVRLSDWGEGTNIQGALTTAVEDIRASRGEVETSDVLLITDGESPLDEAWLRETFGSTIRLHVAMVGHDNTLLSNPEITTSYERYS